MKRFFIVSIAAGTLTLGAAQAQSVMGNDQLAREIGVAPGAYTLAQLIQMRSAKEDGNMTEFRYIRDGLRIGSFSTSSEPKAGRITAAEKLEVDPRSLSFVDIHNLALAKAAGQAGPVAAFWSNKDPDAPSRRTSHVSQGEAQLAAGLGVDPAGYTLAELVQMKTVADTD